jgi:hypothetical protein
MTTIKQLEEINIGTFQQMIINNRFMTPAAKGLAGMILFKVEHKLELDTQEEKFLEELHLFLKIPKGVSRNGSSKKREKNNFNARDLSY